MIFPVVGDALASCPPLIRMSLGLGGAEVVMGVILDEGELDRRRRRSAKPILSLDLLNLLVELPLSSQVVVGEVAGYERRLLQAGFRIAAVDLAEVDGVAWVTRRAVPPLWVRHVMVTTRGWRHGLRVASRFAPYSSRELVVDRLPIDEVALRLEAGYLGVGVSVAGDSPDSPLRRVIDPAPFVPARFTGASWLLAERLFAGLAPLDG